MSTNVWFRNPADYIRELVETDTCLVAWDRGLLLKRSIDPIKHAELYFGRSFPWELLVVGPQGTSHYKQDCTIDTPVAVYPTWSYGEDAALLEEMVAQPAGDDPTVYGDASVEADLRPVKGQSHVVVVTDLPNGSSGPGKSFLAYLKVLQEDYPDCTIHVHGLYSFRLAFGMGFKSADIEPREYAKKGNIMLPSGKIEKFEIARKHPQWVTQLGFKPVDLEVPRNRCMYNIKSAKWAAQNFSLLYNMPKINTGAEVDTTSPDSQHKRIETKSPLINAGKVKEGDKFLCDTCSLQDKCSYFRDGAVCSVPGAEPRTIAQMFRTRDSGQIIEGLSTLAAASAARLERGMRVEEAVGELDPEVSKAMNQAFGMGVQLAKLVDPTLRPGGTKVQVNVGAGGAAAVAVMNPKQMAAQAIQALVDQGIPRHEITSDMVAGLLAGMANPDQAQRAIESPIQGEIIDKSA